MNQKTGEVTVAKRTRLMKAAINVHTESEEAIKLLFGKYVEDAPSFAKLFTPLSE